LPKDLENIEIPESETYDSLLRGEARCRHLRFMEYCWQRHKDFKIGVHTEAICNEIDTAFQNYRNGVSTFLIILVCHRQGKSEIVSRFLPAHFLGEFPDSEVVLTSHNATLAYKFSRFSRSVVKSSRFHELYPDVGISKERAAVGEWGIEGTQGAAQFMGILSGTAGIGGNLIVVDDYLGTREDAESEVMREKLWDAYTDDIFTRRNHPCILLFTVTPWHVDDIVGRIKLKMDDDKSYPQFKVLKFPAKSSDYSTGYLFPEMYPEVWYKEQEVVLGKYGWASLGQCDPQIKAGNMLRTDKIKYYEDDAEIPDDIQWVRGWDLASSSKQKVKSDPDYTVGVKMGIKWIKSTIPGHDIPIIYIDDVVRGQWESTQRNKIIIGTTIADGFIRCGIEAFAAYKDAYVDISNVLKGIRSVEKMQLPGDKVTKASPLEPVFEAGNVYMRRADWNAVFLNVVGAFPGGAHDDDVDALAVGYGMCKTSGLGLYTGEMFEESTERRHKLIETTNARIKAREQVTCELDDYMAFLREHLQEKAKDESIEEKKNYIINETKRLDSVLGYDELEGVV